MAGFEVTSGHSDPDAILHKESHADAPNYEGAYGIDDRWIVEGARCDGKAGKEADCFLPDGIRDRLIGDFKINVDFATDSFRQAVIELKVDQLVAKDDDLPWMLSLALDLASAHVASMLGNALKRASGPALAEVRQMAGARAVVTAIAGQAPDTSWPFRAREKLAGVTPEKLDAWTKVAFASLTTRAKKSVAHETSSVPAPDAEQKTKTLSYLDQLTDEYSLAFHRFASSASADAADAELIVLWYGMKREHHSVGAYKAALKAKLDRYHKSGVAEIGKSFPSIHLGRDRRVVLVQDIYGKQVPWFQH